MVRVTVRILQKVLEYNELCFICIFLADVQTDIHLLRMIACAVATSEMETKTLILFSFHTVKGGHTLAHISVILTGTLLCINIVLACITQHA